MNSNPITTLLLDDELFAARKLAEDIPWSDIGIAEQSQNLYF